MHLFWCFNPSNLISYFTWQVRLHKILHFTYTVYVCVLYG